jgi:siroheme synthase
MYARVDTVIVLMAVQTRAEIARCLMAQGRAGDEPVAFIENGTTPRERVVVATLAEVAAGAVEVQAPAVMVIGRVVAMRERLASVALEFCAAS